jgi:uncharacterized protein (TIGR03435 family)
MARVLTSIATTAIVCGGAFGQQPSAPPRFETADVHAKATTAAPSVRTNLSPSGRYEVRSATMVDLIRISYGSAPDKILGGPDWLETDRFDVIAKAPAGVGKESLNSMLRSLLADRFKLVAHSDTKPVLAYVLKAGAKPLLKPADGSVDAGCKPEAPSGSGPPGSGRGMINGVPVLLGPDRTVHYLCRNMTMAAFAEVIPRLVIGGGMAPVFDLTGLKGAWNFDLRWSLLPGTPGADAGAWISIFDAVDKQLGLKLGKEPVPTPVIVVDSVNEKPTPNPPGIAAALPPIPLPEKFDLAVIKPAEAGPGPPRLLVQPGGRVVVQAMTLSALVTRALHVDSDAPVVGLPNWAAIKQFDITAQAPPTQAALDAQDVGPMLHALLVERFKLATHTEERPVPVYELVARRPKLKKASAENRASCSYPQAASGTTPPFSLSISCKNMTMARFASQLRHLVPSINLPVFDETGLEGGWDFTLSYTRPAFLLMGRGTVGEPSSGLEASTPDGALSFFEALEKQLGLKLEERKRTMSVIVVDHLEEKPTEN